MTKKDIIRNTLTVGGLFALAWGAVWFTSYNAQKPYEYEDTKKIIIDEGDTYSSIAKDMISEIDSINGSHYQSLIGILNSINEEEPTELQPHEPIEIPDFGEGYKDGEFKEYMKKRDASLDRLRDSAEDSSGEISSTNNNNSTNPNTYLESLEEMIKDNEEFKSKAYDCSEGYRTIGYGFNLERNDAEERFEDLGYDFEKVYDMEVRISHDHAEQLLETDLEAAQREAKAYLGDETFNSIHPKAKMVVVDMAYNLGYPTLTNFEGFKQALQNLDYDRAANELLFINGKDPSSGKTDYYKDTKTRAIGHYSSLNELPDTRT